MNCFNQKLRRLSPMRDSSTNDLVPSKPPRVNGWLWPPQIFQVVAWLVYLFLTVVGFGIYIPLLPLPWTQVAYALIGILCVVHFIAHIAAVTVDPADANVRAKLNYSSPVPLFDRTKRAHVIQELHCYLCDVKVGNKTKHCRVCNKCVEDFDHHCVWLNNCIGGRNYWLFFVALTSATLGALLLIAVILFIFIQHYLDPNSLRTDPQFDSVMGNCTWLVFLPLASVKTTSAGLLTLAFITVMLGVICLILVGHLLGFQFYLLYKGISTYEYVTMKRQKETQRQACEGEIPHDAKRHKTVAQNEENADVCETSLSQNSSICKNEGPHTSRTSICNELETCKKLAEKESGFYHGSKKPTENMMEMSVNSMKSLKPETVGEIQSAAVTCVEQSPGVQDPMGSSIMTPYKTLQ
ncbi:probable palmitoyltransferase ZDHHC11 [Thalassophryne amazonica]|uniref:probable palmitoyltransferase ZDHHC11 n=1 Tax=Thalassophryne amazonica TaxID=390379 RepID=UPI00147115FA|nr:probable palmitoyltransferase ZDHHC11 [Thalassophryne amazonica]